MRNARTQREIGVRCKEAIQCGKVADPITGLAATSSLFLDQVEEAVVVEVEQASSALSISSGVVVDLEATHDSMETAMVTVTQTSGPTGLITMFSSWLKSRRELIIYVRHGRRWLKVSRISTNCTRLPRKTNGE